MRRLTWNEITALRAERWRTALLVLTDRCTVGCAHCSVSARADSARVTDFALLEELVDGLCAEPAFEAIGVTGGEPFSEARALSYVAERVSACDKQLILYTSGVWAGAARCPQWIREVLQRTSCVVLGSDAYHAERLPQGRIQAAIRTVVAAGAWLVVQVIGSRRGSEHEHERDEAERMLADALGPDWASFAEVNVVRMLPYGRGAHLFADADAEVDAEVDADVAVDADTDAGAGTAPSAGRELGPCTLVHSPTVRFDGVVTACCDERVITGAGPSGLRRRVRDRAEMAAALADLRDDAFLRLLGGAGPAVLTRLPRFADLGDEPFRQVCGLCWRAVRRVDASQEPDPMLLALAGALTGARG